MKTIAVFLADGFEEIEALTPVDYLRRAGLNVIIVGVKGQTFNNSLVVTGSHKIQVIVDMTLNDYLSTYSNNLPDCVVCPGGLPGATNLSESKELLKHIEDVYNKGNFVSALCASPAVVLSKTTVLKDKKWTCYPGMENNACQEYSSNYSDEIFITDKNLVTGRGPGASEQFAMELVKLLAGQEIYDKIKKGSCLR